jgi:proline racemase
VIAAATIALEQRLLFAGDTIPEMRLVFDTLAGTVQATARIQERGDTLRVDSVAMLNVPSFVHTPAYPVKLGSRELRVDVAFGGIFHAIVDTEAVGIPIDAAHLPELRRLAVGVLAALDAAADVVHPADPSQRGVRALTLTSGPRDPEAHLRNVTITAGGAVDPSASVSGTSAVIAVLDAMGLLPEGQEFVHEGLTGSLLRGRALRRTQVGELPAVVTEITGTAWITGEHTFVLDDDDPFRDGFSL